MKIYPKNKYEKDSESLHLYVKDIKILTPSEYKALKSEIPKERHKTILDILLITGLRYEELRRLYDNPQWYNEKNNLIHLPEVAQKKVKRRQLERTIQPLPSMFSCMFRDISQASIRIGMEQRSSKMGSECRYSSLWTLGEDYKKNTRKLVCICRNSGKYSLS
jgi:hypothetical protein